MNLQGLSQEEARRRLVRDGPNEMPSAQRRPFLQHLVQTLREPMTSLLAACGVVYALIGDQQEAFMLLAFWALIIFITLYQERRTENALAALKKLSSPRALVIRDNEKKRVPALELVVGDLLQLNEGDIVPADVVLLEAFQVLVDESLLTGESFPVDKKVNSASWAGTTFVSGQAIAQVVATGTRTEMGKIGNLLKPGRSEETHLKIETRHLVKVLTFVAIALCVLTASVYAWMRQDVLGGILVGLTLAMAILPNELPAVLTIFLALGTRRISQYNILTRRLPAVENIGATTVLCVDKTGTLTMNKMEIQKKTPAVGSTEKLLLQSALLASNKNSLDPMEQAIEEALGESEKIESSPLLQFPLTSNFFAISNVWPIPDSNKCRVTSKGAPEAILKMCHLSDADEAMILKNIDSLAGQGLRVLGVAEGTCEIHHLPHKQSELRLRFLGLLGFADPVRPGVTASIDLCNAAGIQVIMVTGDHSQTASAVAQQVGLKNPHKVLLGHQMATMSDSDLLVALRDVHCMARMIPEQKLRVVQLLQGQGEVVAMTGDGVNDAPALMAAQVGIAMGKKGTDVARESASIVLLDDDFSSIVQGIRIGRGIYDNLQSAMSYLLAIHLPIAGISILPVFLDLPLVLMPVHIAFLHLLIEPACSLVFESEPLSADIMQRKPRGREDKFFSKKLILPSLWQGAVVYVMTIFIFVLALNRGQGELDARALTFTTLIFANLGLIFMNRSSSRSFLQGFQVINRPLAWMLFGSILILGLVLYVPFLRQLFRFSFLHPIDILLSFSAAMLSVLWFEIWKRFRQ